MMERYELRRLSAGTESVYFNIPINLKAYNVDNSDVIERDFVSTEMDKAVNPIVDYDVVRVRPVMSVESITYKVRLRNNGNTGYLSTYGDIGFTDTDIKYKLNNFKRSFLQLDFYDDISLTKQNFLYSSTLFCRLNTNDSNITNSAKDNVDFTVSDPVKNPKGIAEGFFLYEFKDEIPKDIYMRAVFNNAKTGKIHKLMFVNTINGKTLSEVTHIKYSLTRESDGYYYKINGYDNATNIAITLYEVNL